MIPRETYSFVFTHPAQGFSSQNQDLCQMQVPSWAFKPTSQYTFYYHQQPEATQ